MVRTKKQTEIRSLATRIGVEDRRNLVRGYQKQHLSVREIAEKCDVKMSTTEADIRWLDKEAAGLFNADELGKKSNELQELTEMEATAIKHWNKYSRLADQYEKEDPPNASEARANKLRIDTARQEAKYWFNKRLEIKDRRAKWLWFDQRPKGDKEETAVGDINIDNRKITVNLNGRKEDPEIVEAMEYLAGNVRELQVPVEVVDVSSS